METFQARIQKYLKARGWDELRPSDVAKSVLIEGAELLEIFQWDNQPAGEVKSDVEKMEKIRKELADVMIYCFEMASILDVDLEKALNEKLTNAEEKYPVELFNKETRNSDPGTEGIYWEIKEAHRRKGTE